MAKIKSGNHENINIDEQVIRNRMKLIRQNRKDVEHLNCMLETGSKSYRLKNISAFGLLLHSDNEKTGQLSEGTLIVNDIEIETLRLRLARAEKDETGGFWFAFEVMGDPICTEAIDAIADVQKLIHSHELYQSDTKRVPDLFARKIYEIKDWLEDLQEKINGIEVSASKTDNRVYQDYEATFVQVVGEYFNRVLPIKNSDLGRLIANYDETTIKACYEFMREKLKKLIYQAPFSDRVFNKPLGYAGDYEMMNIIYRADRLGSSLFAKCLHHYWVHQPAAQAVRNRATFIRSKIEALAKESHGQPLRLLSVACGPAMEWQMILQQRSLSESRMEVALLDQDEEALMHAQRKLKEIQGHDPSSIEFKFVHKAIRNVLARGVEGKFDIIYSAGLFDYLSDPVAQLAAAKLFEALKPGGSLIIGNFDIANPNSIVMDSALDWHLIYRSPDEMKNLFNHLGGAITLEHESLNINLFCTIRKA